MRRLLHRVGGERAFERAADDAARARSCPGIAAVMFSSTDSVRKMPATRPILGHKGEAQRDGVARARGSSRACPSTAMVPLVGGGDRRRARAPRRCGRRRRARRGRRSRPCRTSKLMSRKKPGSVRPVTFSATSPIAVELLCMVVLHRPADHQPDDVGIATGCRSGRSPPCAVAEDRDAVAERAHLFQPVRDEDDGAPFVAQAAGDVEQRRDFLRRQRRGRFVHDDERGCRDASARAISTICWSAMDRPRIGRVTSMPDAQQVHQPPGLGRASRPTARGPERRRPPRGRARGSRPPTGRGRRSAPGGSA